jgi:two-component system nitrate/nitrite response regulator NarL
MPKSVLIVDDSEVVRKIMRHFLETKTDWKIAGEAADGADAIRAARELSPDLILLDFSMPTMNGVEAASVLKKVVPDVRIAMFTMFSDSLGAVLSSSVGVDLIIPKAEGLTNLVQSVQRLMDGATQSNNSVEVSRQDPKTEKRS